MPNSFYSDRLASGTLSVSRLMMLCALTFLGLLGCQDGGMPLYSVQGSLKYAGTKETIPYAGVELRPENPIDDAHRVSIVGSVQEDGTIVFTTFSPGDGVPEGEYRVMLREPPKPSGWDVDDRGGLPPPKIPRKYKSYVTSEITFEVRRQGENRLDIEIEKPAGGR